MARSRLNPKFKIAAAVAALTGVGLGAAAVWKVRHKDPNRYANAGEMYLRQNDLPDALAAFAFASSLRPTDPQLHLRVAHVHDLMRDQNFGVHLNAAIDEYTHAEELQPDLKEAWQGLLDTNMAAAMAVVSQNTQKMQENLYHLPERFGIARDAARHLLTLDPTDYKARAAIPILTVNLWLQNLSIPLTADERRLPVDRQPTDTQRIDQAVTELTAVMRDHPDDADLPYWIAQARIKQGVNLTRQASGDATPADPAGGPTAQGPAGTGQSPDARAAFDAAAAAFDGPIAKLPKSPQLRYRKFEVISRLMQADPAPAAAAGYRQAQRAALDAAQSLVTPADGSLYLMYKGRWADYLAAVNDVGLAEVAYRQLLARPSTSAAAAGAQDVQRLIEDAQVCLQYARLLSRDPGRRGEALALLDRVPAVAPVGLAAALQQPVTALLAKVRLQRAQILTDQYESAATPVARDEERRAAQAEIDAVRANPRFAGEYELLKMQGRLQLVSGAFRDAIQTLTAAADRRAGDAAPVDLELLYWQATALAGGGQPVQAIKLLEQTIQSPPGANLLQPHLMLARLYLQQQDFDGGRRQVGWLGERYPGDPRTLHAQIELATHDNDAKAVADLYGRLPERTPAEQADKAATADRTHNVADAERLYERVYAALPGDPGTATRLAELYGGDGKPGRANEVLQQAMDLHPDSRGRLQLVKDKLNGASDAAIQQEAVDQINALKDPLAREVSLYRLAAGRHQMASQIEHMEKARALQPDNRRVLADLFAGYLSARAFDKADGLLPRLVELDADERHGLLFKLRLALARGEAGAAVGLGQQLTHDFPQFANSWAGLGDAMRASGRLEAACQQYTASLDRQGNAPEVIARLVDCLIRSGRLDDARRALADARRKFPDVGLYRKQLVQVEMAYGDPESVLPVVDDGVTAHPDGTDNWQLAVQTYTAAAQRRTARGDVAGATGLLDHARQLLADALGRWPDNAGFAAELGDLQSRDGTEAGLAAAAQTIRALAGTPKWQNQVLPDVLLGRMYVRAKRPELAEAPLRHAVEVDPQAVEARVALADSLFGRHLSDQALAVLAPAKDQPAARAKYVDLLVALNRGPEAEAGLLADVSAHPDDPTPGNLLAQVYAVQGKFDAAQDAATRALRANPNDVAAYFIRGSAEVGRSPPDLDAAARDLTTFRSAAPDNLQGRMALAKVLLAKQDVEAATRELEAAVDLAPDVKESRLLLARAYLSAAPPRPVDAERVVTQTLAIPALAHDPEVGRVAAAVYLKVGADDRAVSSIRDAMANAADQRTLLDDYLNVLLLTRHYDTLLAESARFTADPKAAWTVYDFRGRARAADGDVAGAVGEFTTALDRAGTAPDLGPSLVAAAHITAALGLDGAVELVQPRSVNGTGWKVVLAACYSQAGNAGRALSTVEAAMPSIATLPPGDQLTLNRMAAQLYMTATPPQPDRAVDLFQAVLKAAPADLDALNNVACLLAELVDPPRPAEALTYSQRAVDTLHRRGEANPLIEDTHGWALILNGRLDEGIEVLRPIASRADFPDVHYHLAMGYLRKGNGSDAGRELDAALRLCRAATAARQSVDPALPAKIAAAQRVASDLANGRPHVPVSP